jgi:hypothetical protein
MEHVLRYVTIGLTIVLIALIRLGYRIRKFHKKILSNRLSCTFGVEYSRHFYLHY